MEKAAWLDDLVATIRNDLAPFCVRVQNRYFYDVPQNRFEDCVRQRVGEHLERVHRELAEAHDDVEVAREGAANVVRAACRLCFHAPCICPKAPPYK